MPFELVLAYAIFCITPVALAISLVVRRRNIRQKLASSDAKSDTIVV